MKLIRFILITIIVSSIIFGTDTVLAQGRFEITPYIGYQFSGSVPYTTGKFDIKNSPDYGLVVDIPLPLRDGVELELLYIRMDTKLKYDQYSYGVITKSEEFDMIVEYYQIGALNVFEMPGSSVKPFGGLTLGASRFNPNGTERGDEWFFSATLGAGVKIIPSERIGIRLQGRLLMPFQWGSAGLWCGTGGCSAGVGTTSVFLQGDFTAGLIIRL
jgi:hypothetical protein